MLKKLRLLLLFKLFIFSTVWAQSDSQEAIFSDGKMNHPADLIQKNYKPNRQELSSLCMNSVAFVKFNIGADSLVNNVAVSVETPSSIALALKDAIRATNGYWTPKQVNGKPVESDPFIMPFVFYYSLGCEGEVEVMRSNKFNVGMDNMLNFDDGQELSMMKCTLLPAFITASHN
jgi:hypothetical protein